MFNEESHCKTPQVVDATDGKRHTRKRGLRTLNEMLSLRTLKRTLSLRTLKRTLKMTLKERRLGGGGLFGVLRYWKDVSVGAEYMFFELKLFLI